MPHQTKRIPTFLGLVRFSSCTAVTMRRRIAVALFLRKIGLEDIILHERPNGGRRLLTKFREEAEGRLAVILIIQMMWAVLLVSCRAPEHDRTSFLNWVSLSES